MQAVCDRQKKVLWISPMHQGSTHDSTAFFETELFDLLENLEETLSSLGLFLVGDSAYAISRTLLVPYSNTTPGKMEDAFNFWLSNSRIQIECTFGEIVMRWGMLWRRMGFNLQHTGTILQTMCLLHNYLVENRDDNYDENEYFKKFSQSNIDKMFDDASNIHDDDTPIALVVDTGAQKRNGRKSSAEKEKIIKGKKLRDNICLSLSEVNMKQHMKRNMKVNDYGHIYFE